MTARYWDASDRERDESDWDEPGSGPVFWLDAERAADIRENPRVRTRADNRRRRKKFSTARGAMMLMVMMRGQYSHPITVTSWFRRNGGTAGIFTYYDDDHEIQWTPRKGFQIIEFRDIPF